MIGLYSVCITLGGYWEYETPEFRSIAATVLFMLLSGVFTSQYTSIRPGTSRWDERHALWAPMCKILKYNDLDVNYFKF